MCGREVLHVSETDVVIPALVQDDDGVAPAVVVGGIAARVVGEIREPVTDFDDLTVDRREEILPEGVVVGAMPAVEIDAVTQGALVGVGGVLPLRTVPVVAVLKRHEDERAGICLTSKEANPKEKGDHNRDFSVSHLALLARLNVPV